MTPRNMSRTLMAFLLGLIVLEGSAAAQSPRYGVVTGGVFEPIHAAKIAELGSGSIRMDFYWYLIEPQDNQFDWGVVEGHLDRALATNQEIYITIHGTPA